MRASHLLLSLLLCAPISAIADDGEAASETEAPADSSPTTEAPATETPGEPTLDLSLHRDPTKASDEEVWWGALRVTAKLDTTMLYLDGEFIGEGKALRDRISPGVHLLEGRLASGRKMTSSVLVRPGHVVSYEVHMGDKTGEQAYAVLLNVAAIVAATAFGTAAAIDGSQPIPTDMPGLVTPLDALKAGNRDVERP